MDSIETGLQVPGRRPDDITMLIQPQLRRIEDGCRGLGFRGLGFYKGFRV